mgnify:CR=1 FL=1
MNAREHLLVCLAEEAAEVVQAVTKALRFGLHDSYPGYAGGLTNEEAVYAELNDLLAVVEMLEDDGSLTPFMGVQSRGQKQAKVRKFMEHARRNGALE